jgi:uncharacterized protein YndB with AHSA1/START domain
MILRIVIIIAVLIAAILAFAATKPKTFHVQRSIIISASPEKVFALINDFHNWSSWAPQDKQDPTMNRTYAGAAKGKDAVSDWDSTGSAGKGRMTMTESVPYRMISINVDFVKPFEAHNINEFAFEPAGTSTKVTWTMNGTNLYIMKIMSVFRNMDRVIGRHFESGLDNLKTVAEH